MALQKENILRLLRNCPSRFKYLLIFSVSYLTGCCPASMIMMMEGCKEVKLLLLFHGVNIIFSDDGNIGTRIGHGCGWTDVRANNHALSCPMTQENALDFTLMNPCGRETVMILLFVPAL